MPTGCEATSADGSQLSMSLVFTRDDRDAQEQAIKTLHDLVLGEPEGGIH